MENVASILTITLPSFIAYEDWLKRTREFFLSDEKIKKYLTDNGLKKWTYIKTDDEEPIKVVIIFEYKDKISFNKCQPVFLKFMPQIRDLVYKSNIVRGKIILDEI
tara:strand:+ start:281 stop:598 length:318 start_codon:yes stop_codon:yes gene_type:complete